MIDLDGIETSREIPKLYDIVLMRFMFIFLSLHCLFGVCVTSPFGLDLPEEELIYIFILRAYLTRAN